MIRFAGLLSILLLCSACGTRQELNIPDFVHIHNATMLMDSQNQPVPQREVRHFAVYKDGQLVLKGEDKPGVLLSTAHPSPDGPAKHAFINAQAMRSTSENETGALLRQSTSYDDYLQKLLAKGYDLFSIVDSPLPNPIDEGWRISSQGNLVAVLWATPGQFAYVQQQPTMSGLRSTFASMVAYDPNAADSLLPIFREATDLSRLKSALKSAGYDLHSL